MAEELKPCPFCSGLHIDFMAETAHWLSCGDCQAEGPIQDTEAEAVTAWNTRSEGPLPVGGEGGSTEALCGSGAQKRPSLASAGVAETPSGGWQDIAVRGPPEAPGNYVNVRSVLTYRYLAYKPDGARQMKKLGRWQRATEHGWENADIPEHGEWTPNYPAPPQNLAREGEGEAVVRTTPNLPPRAKPPALPHAGEPE